MIFVGRSAIDIGLLGSDACYIEHYQLTLLDWR